MANPTATLQTSLGDITVELLDEKAPISCENFRQYVKDGHFDGTIFHRVIAEFVVQGGGYTPEFVEKPVREPALNESGNGLPNRSGSIAMARYNDPHSATSQFFFNMNNNESLNPNPRSWGYTVFGVVVSGMEVLEEIAAVKTGYSEALDAEDVPMVPVLLIKASVQ